jgi:histidine ammonia-lyase
MKHKPWMLTPGALTESDIQTLYYHHTPIMLSEDHWQQIEKSARAVEKIIQHGQSVYGVNTGFGSLATQKIPVADLSELQKRLVLSHAAGVGEPLSPTTVRLLLLFKINSLARGYSGIKTETLKTLIALYNQQLLPCIPAQGSVGASGDLAPLAHMAAVLMGIGRVDHEGQTISALDALATLNIKPLDFAAKEGLALLNGTQVSTALAFESLLLVKRVLGAAIISGCLSVEAILGSHAPFHPEIQTLRGQLGQIEIAAIYRQLLEKSEMHASHHNCDRVQDPYSIRCQPQVMGACLDQLRYAGAVLLREANAVTDNPLLLSAGEVVSGGNFHAEPVALVADAMACAITEIGSLAERRIALLNDKNLSHLPPFLVENAGLNSGYMIAQVTAAALVSENKQRSYPASVDSIPTSANQEDHVSMATHGARRLLNMVENTAYVIAIELLAATQGIELRRPLRTSASLEKIVTLIRQAVPHYSQDRLMNVDIETVKNMILNGAFCEWIDLPLC